MEGFIVMDTKDKYIDTQNVNYKILNKKRGEILYYSVDQVADLLNENVNNIRYYTSIFDDLLKIEIVHKELRYNNNDVDKLDFLIKLKNRGMSLKEIQDYYNKLPLNDTEIEHSESNLLSVEDLIDSIKKEQQIQLNNFKAQLFNDIKNTNSLYLENLNSTIIEAQNKILDEFKQNLTNEIKEYIDSKFDSVNEINSSLHNKLIDTTIEFMSEKIENKSNELKLNLLSNFDTFSQSSLTKNECLIKEVRDFKKIMQDAYYTQCEVDEAFSSNTGFWNKLLKTIKSR